MEIRKELIKKMIEIKMDEFGASEIEKKRVIHNVLKVYSSLAPVKEIERAIKNAVGIKRVLKAKIKKAFSYPKPQKEKRKTFRAKLINKVW